MELIEMQVFNRILINQYHLLAYCARQADTMQESGHIRECMSKTSDIRQRLLEHEEATKPTNPS